jgi:hypothetical protein
MMAQVENTGGQGGPFVTQGDLSVSYSRDRGVADPRAISTAPAAIPAPA